MIWMRIAAVAAIGLGAVACQQSRADTSDAATAVVQPAPDAQVAVADAAATDTIVVYKTPSCGCCKNWVEHIKENGYAVVVHDLDDLKKVKLDAGVSPALESCHTAIVRGYTIEGHVPADVIRKLLAEKPGVRGLAVPGMPMGSPGMEGVMKQAYKVLAFDAAGKTTVYAER